MSPYKDPQKRKECVARWHAEHPERIRQIKRKYQVRRIAFKNQRIALDENPRTNVCSNCGRKYPDELDEQTCFHHDEYDKSDVSANTRELCRSCHNSLHRNLELEAGVKLFAGRPGHR